MFIKLTFVAVLISALLLIQCEGISMLAARRSRVTYDIGLKDSGATAAKLAPKSGITAEQLLTFNHMNDQEFTNLAGTFLIPDKCDLMFQELVTTPDLHVFGMAGHYMMKSAKAMQAGALETKNRRASEEETKFLDEKKALNEKAPDYADKLETLKKAHVARLAQIMENYDLNKNAVADTARTVTTVCRRAAVFSFLMLNGGDKFEEYYTNSMDQIKGAKPFDFHDAEGTIADVFTELKKNERSVAYVSLYGQAHQLAIQRRVVKGATEFRLWQAWQEVYTLKDWTGESANPPPQMIIAKDRYGKYQWKDADTFETAFKNIMDLIDTDRAAEAETPFLNLFGASKADFADVIKKPAGNRHKVFYKIGTWSEDKCTANLANLKRLLAANPM